MDFVPKVLPPIGVSKRWYSLIHYFPIRLRFDVRDNENFDKFGRIMLAWKRPTALIIILRDHKKLDMSTVVHSPQLKSLYVVASRISNIRSLSRCSELEVLDLHCPGIYDIRFLSCCRKLTVLTLSETQVSDISPLAECKNLRDLYLGGAPVSVIAPLAWCPNLETLDLSETLTADLSSLKNLKNIKALDLTDCVNVVDASFVSELPSLKTLDISRTNIQDLDPIANSRTLRMVTVPREVYEGGFKTLGRACVIPDLYVKGFGYVDLDDICDDPGCRHCRMRSL
jgi:hypothetical protein